MRRLVGLVVAAAATLAALRIPEAIQQWPFLTEWVALSPWYFVVSGAFWGVSGWALALGVWRGWGWTQRGVVLWVGGGLAWWWFERLILSAASVPPPNWPFALGVSLLLLAVTLWSARRLRRDAPTES
jgi:hypothetical protein